MSDSPAKPPRFSGMWLYRAAIGACLSVLSFTALAVVGQPGTLDPTWGANSPLGPGKVMTYISHALDYARSMLLQPDGKILVVGSCSGGGSAVVCAVRYNANGTLDREFGDATGIKVNNLYVSENVIWVYAAALQRNGKYLVTGSCTSKICVARYAADGSLDASFGHGGRVQMDSSVNEWARAIALQADGKIVLAGFCNFSCALRFHEDGTVDTSFGVGGRATIPSFWVNAGAITVQADGKLVLAGSCRYYSLCMVRYNMDGTPDLDFGVGGRVETIILSRYYTTYDPPTAIALQPDGKIVLASFCDSATGANFCALRYYADGSLDTTFGSNGISIIQIGANTSKATAIVRQPDGKFVLTGQCSNGTNLDFCAIRLNENGTLDTRFGSAGKVIIAVGSGLGDDNAYAAALQPDGKIVVAGYCRSSEPSIGIIKSNDDFCAIRLDGDQFGAGSCLDLDGDGVSLATTDALIHARIAAGITGDAMLNDVTISAGATRNTWRLIKSFVTSQCAAFGTTSCSLDIDGDGTDSSAIDAVIHARLSFGMTGDAVTDGIAFPASATRNNWPLIRNHLISHCGLNLP